MSRPVWGAWIEITPDAAVLTPAIGRAPYGARGLKCYDAFQYVVDRCRAPYGARGLKFLVLALLLSVLWSRPVWGAWIEILVVVGRVSRSAGVAPRMGRVD